MQIASRFPVKNCASLFVAILTLHLLLLVCGVSLLNESWQFWLASALVLVSLYFSIQRYKDLTSAPDDLCWTGENWIIQNLADRNRIIYLTVEEDSWLSSFASILHCNDGTNTRSWLFTRWELGDRSYSELCYLVKLSIKQNNSPD